jgi:hypothetical protein
MVLTAMLDGIVKGPEVSDQGEAMQDLGYELPRIPIPRTRVNKGKRKGQSCSTPTFILAPRAGAPTA